METPNLIVDTPGPGNRSFRYYSHSDPGRFGQIPFHTCDSTAGSKRIPFSKPVCGSAVLVDQTTIFENFRKCVMGITKNRI